MSKFCQNCGNMMDDSAAFCDKCGKPGEAVASAAPAVEAPVAETPAVETPAVETPAVEAPAVEAPAVEAPVAEAPVEAPAAPQYGAAPQYTAPQYGAAPATVAVQAKKSFLTFVKEKKVLLIVAAIVLVLAIVAAIVVPSMANNNPEGALKKAFEATKNLDIRGAADYIYDLNFSTTVDKEEQIKTAEDQIKQYGGMLDMVKGMLKDAKLEIKNNKALSAEEVDNLKKEWADSYKDTDKIEAINELTYSITGVSMFGAESDDQEETCYAVKVGGKWYIQGMSSLGL